MNCFNKIRAILAPEPKNIVDESSEFIQRLQIKLTERDKVIDLCLEELHRLTGIKDYDLSRVKLAEKNNQEKKDDGCNRNINAAR